MTIPRSEPRRGDPARRGDWYELSLDADMDCGSRGSTPRRTEPTPAGIAGDRYVPASRFATSSGGTSGAEDTTRAAGYTADLTVRPVRPPGPRLLSDPILFAHPGKELSAVEESALASSKSNADSTDSALDGAALARMQGESPVEVLPPPPRSGSA